MITGLFSRRRLLAALPAAGVVVATSRHFAPAFNAWEDPDLEPILKAIERVFNLDQRNRFGASEQLAALAGQPDRIVDCAGCILIERQALELWLAAQPIV